MKRGRMYEEERLLLYLQEELAVAIVRCRKSKRDICKKLGIHPASLSRSLSGSGDKGLSIERAAAIAWAAGYRIVPRLERIEGHQPPEGEETP